MIRYRYALWRIKKCAVAQLNATAHFYIVANTTIIRSSADMTPSPDIIVPISPVTKVDTKSSVSLP